MKGLHSISFILLVVGGLNWLLFVWDTGLGFWLSDSIANVIYVLVGLAAIYELLTHKKNCKLCDKGSVQMGS